MSIDIVDKALAFAVEAHRGQQRKRSGLPYIHHPIAVVGRLSQWGVSRGSVWAAGYLHDVLEDCPSASYTNIETEFGREIAQWVDELTYTGQGSKADYLASFMDKSIPSLLIKLADRLCNVEDFRNFGDKDYARKYLLKGRPVFKAFYQRGDEILDKFGETFWMNVNGDIWNVAWKVNVNRVELAK